METQTRLSRHNKFISAENIIAMYNIMRILFLHIYIYIYIYIYTQSNWYGHIHLVKNPYVTKQHQNLA